WAIAENAKCQRPGVCNAMETLLVHKEIAADFLPKMGALFHAQNVKLLGDSTCCQQIPSAQPACEEDWYKEYLDLTLSIRVVDHIERCH
ncbi:MAG: gamma-glutamyl-phosphate reductase, partial [Kiritimatiellaceae bacterium]|nr:gamma-glutamyl-phosphate reductase [Kiritimatiellaceae bacterium]